jgi:hypothetical protein
LRHQGGRLRHLAQPLGRLAVTAGSQSSQDTIHEPKSTKSVEIIDNDLDRWYWRADNHAEDTRRRVILAVERGIQCVEAECGEASMTYCGHSAHDDEPTIRPAGSRGFELIEVRTAVEGIHYGEVRLIIQDGIIVQIERVEKRRLQ